MAFQEIKAVGYRRAAGANRVTVAHYWRPSGYGTVEITIGQEVRQRLMWVEGVGMEFREGTGADYGMLQIVPCAGSKLKLNKPNKSGTIALRVQTSVITNHSFQPETMPQEDTTFQTFGSALTLMIPPEFLRTAP